MNRKCDAHRKLRIQGGQKLLREAHRAAQLFGRDDRNRLAAAKQRFWTRKGFAGRMLEFSWVGIPFINWTFFRWPFKALGSLIIARIQRESQRPIEHLNKRGLSKGIESEELQFMKSSYMVMSERAKYLGDKNIRIFAKVGNRKGPTI